MEELVFMKMYLFKLQIILFLALFHANHCQRRIVGGESVSKDKKYVVYLLKAATSPRNYDTWLCGGAIVTPHYIMTSAACVIDVLHLYAIAGYNKYVRDTEIKNDPCTKEKAKKIVYTCIHKDYHLDFHRPEKWSYIDIAVVKVESAYDFTDATYATICSYTPAAIPINYESKYQEPGIDAIVLGWGHKTNYRGELDVDNLNQETLLYGPVLIQSKEECKKEYEVYPEMGNVIDKYMICTQKKGNLDNEGVTIVKPLPTAQGCEVTRKLRSNLPECENNATGAHVAEETDTRKNIKLTNLTVNEAELKLSNVTNSRRTDSNVGICQNDHGGPLVTWIGAHEVLIGIASAFKVTETLECIGPYLYTSTQCNGAFLSCILAMDPEDTNTLRRAICKDFVNETGFELLETHISWKEHPDGPADNERNITIDASVNKNITNNVTLNLKNSKEEGNKTDQLQNTTKLVTNTNDTTPTLSTENSTFTRTTKATTNYSTPHNSTKTNTTKTTKSSTVLSSSDTSATLQNDKITNETSIGQPTNDSTKKSRSIVSKNYTIEDSGGRITTVLMQSVTNLSSTTTTIKRDTTTVKPGKTTSEKVNVTTTIDSRTTNTTHVYLKSATAKTPGLELAKPTRTTILGIN